MPRHPRGNETDMPLKPSLIAARARTKAPTSRKPGSGRVGPSGPQLGARPKHGPGPNPLAVAAVALAAGILLAKLIDWRGRARARN